VKNSSGKGIRKELVGIHWGGEGGGEKVLYFLKGRTINKEALVGGKTGHEVRIKHNKRKKIESSLDPIV